MKICSLSIANFKAIERIDLEHLQDMVVIAGPNGCGKSTIFDAIRFWKSALGTYQHNEMRSWLQELGLSEKEKSLLYAHQNKTKPFSIDATVRLSDCECKFLQIRADEILAFYYFKLNNSREGPGAPPMLTMQNLDLIEEFRLKKDSILRNVSSNIDHFRQQVSANNFVGSVSVGVDGSIATNAPIALRVILSVFIPDDIGIIDYIGPQRVYARENVANLNLRLDDANTKHQAGSTLYNTSQRHSNVKSALASSYVRALISERAGVSTYSSDSLEASIVELFNIFIPGKKFDGIKPTSDGHLTFDVSTSAGQHDIGDLSSGEKELIYGYLQLKNSGLANSVILIDEPELHLNPRLTVGLPDFYHRHIGMPANNQLWLITHSDNVLRQSVDMDGCDVFHMQTVGTYEPSAPQLIRVTANDDLDRAIVDLVGDLAAYRPGGKLVMLEGGGDTEFDLEVVTRLFPDFAQRVNLISSGKKSRVRTLHDVLDKIGRERGLFSDVHSIVDRDGDAIIESISDKRHRWDRYSIENYLLEPYVILDVLSDNFVNPLPSLCRAVTKPATEAPAVC